MCPACGAEEAILLGLLGTRKHYRCRACGLDYSHDTAARIAFRRAGVLAGQYPKHVTPANGYHYLDHYDRGDGRALCRASLRLNDDTAAPRNPDMCTRCATRARRFPDGIIRDTRGNPLYRKDR